MILRSILLIAALAGLLSVSPVFAQAGGTGVAGGASQQIFQTSGPRPLQEFGKNLSFTYYMSFLGPSPGLGWGETYNAFRDASGNSPYQFLHAANLAYKLAPTWTIGMTLAAVNDISKKVHNGSYVDLGATVSTTDDRQVPLFNYNEREWFNARIYLNTPVINFDWGYLTTNFAFELPTSNDAKDQILKYGVVLTNNLGVYSTNAAWSHGFSFQLISYQYEDAEFIPFNGATEPTRYQTMLITMGPYLNYMLDDSWQIASKLVLDWDKQGNQTVAEFNNNLPHWGRLALNRYIKDSILNQVGVYSQFMLEDAGLNRTVFGFDLTARF